MADSVRHSLSVPAVYSALSTPRISYEPAETTVTGYEHGGGTVCRRVGVPGCTGVGCGGGVYRGGYYPAPPLPAVHWYCQDPTSTNTAVLRPPWGTPGPAGPPHTPWLPALRYASWSQIGRDSASNILKLVINHECRLKVSMRPAILPISKSMSNVTTLNFQKKGYG